MTSQEVKEVLNDESIINELVEKSQETPKNYFLAMYIGNNGCLTVSHIQVGWDTRPTSLGFGCEPKTREEVIEDLHFHIHNLECEEDYRNNC